MIKLLADDDVKRFEGFLKEAKNIVLTCHVRPDGDAIGSTLGLAHVFRKIGKTANVVTPDRPPRIFDFLPGARDIAVYSQHEEYVRRLVGDADLIVCCDFNRPSRQDRLAPLIQEAHCRKVLIDHHQDPDKFADVMFSFPKMSSASELSFRLLAALGLYTDIDREAATCLLTGIVTDTRNFSVNCPDPEIYEVLTLLMQKGADKTEIVRKAMLTRSLSSLRLESYALLEKLEIFPASRAAVITLDAAELKDFNYERGDTEGLVNRPLEISGIISSFFLREDADCVKISARSVNDFPVSLVCQELFGGGGHVMASGAEFKGSLEDCRRILVEALPNYNNLLPRQTERVSMG